MTWTSLSANAITRDDGAEISRRYGRREPSEPKRAEFVAHGAPVAPGGELAALVAQMDALGMGVTVRPLVGVYATADEAREAL